MIVNVFSYPDNSTRRSEALKYMEELIQIFKTEYAISLDVDIIDGNKIYPSLVQFLTNHFDYYKENNKAINLRGLELFNYIFNKKDIVISELTKKVYEIDDFLELSLIEAKKISAGCDFQKGTLFIILDDSTLRLKDHNHLWGINIGKYPDSISLERTGYKESVFHEFLHQFDVGEGYDPNTYATTCDNSCWMQFDSTMGNSLCDEHQKKLKKFIDNINET
jgi:hypothetical protein